VEQVAADVNPPVEQMQSVGAPLSGAHFALTDDLLAGRFFSIDVRGQITGWNPRAEAAFGWPAHHVSGQSLFEKLVVSGLGFGPDDLERFFGPDGGGAGRRVRVLIGHQAGGQLPVELSIVPIQLAKAYELNAFLQDVSTSTASGVASEIGRVREEHADVLNMISGSLEREPGGAVESRLAGALIVFHIDAAAPTSVPGSTSGGVDAPVLTAAPAEDTETARADAERVRAEIDAAHAAAEEARAEADAARRERDELQARLEAGLADAPAADEAVAAAEAARAEAEAARGQTEEVRAEYEAARAEAEAARGQADAVRADLDAAQAEAETARSQADAARAEYETARAEYDAARAEADAARADAETARAESEAARAELEQLRAAAEQAAARAAEAEAAVEASRTELEQARGDAERLRGELAGLRTAADGTQASAEATAAELGASRAELSQARSDLERLGADLTSAQTQLMEAREERDTLRTEVDDLRARVEVAGEVEAALAEARERIAALDEELAGARADEQAAQDDSAAARAELDQLSKQVEEAERRADEIAADATAAREGGQAAEQAVAAVREEATAARAELEAARERAEAADAELTAAREQAGSLTAELAGARAEADAARAELDTLREEADAARAESERLRDALDAAGAEGQEAASRHAALTAETGVFETIFDTAAIGMAIKADGRLTRVNRALCELTGRDADTLAEIDPVELVHPDEREAYAATEQSLLSGDATASQAEARLVHADGSDVHVRETATLLDDGRVLLQFEPAAAEAHTAVEDHDPITGLFNRRRFEEELSRHVSEAARHGDRGAALMFGLDSNYDRLDAQQGEELLKTVAEALKQNISEAEMVAHLGGDEFAVLLPHADGAHARKIAEHIVEAVGPQVVRVGDQSVRVTIDVGVALFDEREETAPTEPHPADGGAAPGDNLPVPADSGFGTEIGMSDGVVARIRKALAEDGFLLFAQPIIDLNTSEITQYELLLRMRDDSGRLTLPDKFLPAAHEAGLMRAIDQWVVRHAIGLIHSAAVDGRRLMLEVNISADSLDDPALPATIEAELDATGIDPRLLVIEVTEDAALEKIEDAIKLSKKLRAMGCRFAIDDFGSTFATVKYLKDLAVDFFKLDGDLIVTLPESRTNQLLLNALMDVARGTGTQTIAVYVPDDETLVMLRQYGIGYGQGNRVGRPRPVDEI
jgi:diguanylate cyclase (GGDEF)-like protein/PAS domain S-box-containing protein